jgi:hypothetical protein
MSKEANTQAIFQRMHDYAVMAELLREEIELRILHELSKRRGRNHA